MMLLSPHKTAMFLAYREDSIAKTNRQSNSINDATAFTTHSHRNNLTKMLTLWLFVTRIGGLFFVVDH